MKLDKDSKTKVRVVSENTDPKMQAWQDRLDELEEFKNSGRISYRDYQKQLKKINKEMPLSKGAKRVGWIILGIIVLFVFIGALSNSSSDTNKESTPANSEAINKDSASKYCQEYINNYDLINRAGLNKKYLKLIDVWDYNDQLHEGGSYDDKGRKIYTFQWNGKSETNDSLVRFSCWISGDGDTYSIHWISVGGVDLYGSAGFPSYNAEGKLYE